METHLHRIRDLSPASRRRLYTKFSQWLAGDAADVDRAKTLTAFYVGDAQLSPDQVRAFLRERLPDSMVPAELVALDALPKTVNGKVDRRALQQLAPAPQTDGQPRRVHTADERERQMAAIWSRILNVPDVAPDANFFELGGHSLLATQVIMEIEQQFGLEIPLGAIFSHPTVARLCRHLATKQPPQPSTARGVRRVASNDAPLSAAQRRLWYASQASGEGLEYKIVKVLDMHGRMNVAALGQALSEIVNRHESLRTTFRYVSGTLVQRVGPARPVAIEPVDLSGVPAASSGLAEAIQKEIVQRRFDLESGPLIRVSLVRYAATQVRLIFDVHHIVVDGWSFGVLIDEVNSLYRRFSAGRPGELAPLAVQYRDVAVAEANRLSQAELDRQLAYWRGRLAGLPSLEFTRAGGTPLTSGVDGEMEFSFPPSLCAHIAETCSRLQLTPFVFLASAYHLLLQLHTGSRDIAVGTDVANRESKDYAGLIGFFVNQVVLRVTADAAMTFRELCGCTRTAVEEAFANKDLPYETVLSALNASATNGKRASLFRAMFSFHHQLPDIAMDGIVTSFVKVPSPTTKYDLLLSMEQAGNALQGTIEYSGSVFDEGAAAEMAEHFVDLCGRVVRDVDARLAGLQEAAIADSQERARGRREGTRAARQKELRRLIAMQTPEPAREDRV